MDLTANETGIAVFQFVELLVIISLLSVAFVLVLLAYLKNKEKNEELQLKSQQERIITETITQVQESERKRISHDLHDTVTQDIRTALLYIHRMNSLENLSVEQKELLLRIQDIEEKSLKNIRTIIRNLTPPEIETADFIQLLSDFCSGLSNSNLYEETVLCKFYAEPSELYKELHSEQKLHIFRIIQESMNNALKHSGADEISLIARPEEKSLVFLINDNGHGIRNEEDKKIWKENVQDSLLNTSTHLGLKGMKSRADILQGKLEIRSDEETGTQVKLQVPV